MQPAGAADVPKVKRLLERVQLPVVGVPDELAELWVLKDGRGEVMGCVALEIYGDTALLRSLAVHPERRGEGLGWMLAEMAQLRVRQRGLCGSVCSPSMRRTSSLKVWLSARPARNAAARSPELVRIPAILRACGGHGA